MALDQTIPDPQMTGVEQYSTSMPVGSDVPGIIVPPSVLQTLMATSTVLQPKPSAAPPHPQVTAPLAAIPLGYQFAFNQLVSPTPYGNVITAYRIYRNKAANQFSGAQLIRTIIHDPTHQGAVTVQDSTGGNVNYFYFVTAVDSTGQESSTPGSFQASAVASGAANPNISSPTPTSVTPSTTATTFSVIPEMTTTITTKGNKVLLIFTADMFTTSAQTTGVFAIFRDGVQITAAYENTAVTNNILSMISLSFLDAPTAGSHTYDVRWKCLLASESVSNNNLERAFQVVELG